MNNVYPLSRTKEKVKVIMARNNDILNLLYRYGG